MSKLSVNVEKFRDEIKLEQEFMLVRSSKVKDITIAAGFLLLSGMVMVELKNEPSTVNLIDCYLTNLVSSFSLIFVINDYLEVKKREKRLKLVRTIENDEE